MAFFYKYEYTNKRKNIHPCREGQSMPDSGTENQWEPEWQSQRAIEAKKEASLIFLAYQNIILL